MLRPSLEPKTAQPAVLTIEENDIICAITQGAPAQPIIASDGHIYDAANLEEWRKKKKTSPVTKEPLKKTLIPFKLLEKILKEGEPFQLKETDLICPLTKRFMRTPVLASDGILYEKDAIKKAFPRTLLLYEPLCIKDLRERLLKQNPQLEERILEEEAREVKSELGNHIPANLAQLNDDEPVEEQIIEENASGDYLARLMLALYSMPGFLPDAFPTTRPFISIDISTYQQPTDQMLHSAALITLQSLLLLRFMRIRSELAFTRASAAHPLPIFSVDLPLTDEWAQSDSKMEPLMPFPRRQQLTLQLPSSAPIATPASLQSHSGFLRRDRVWAQEDNVEEKYEHADSEASSLEEKKVELVRHQPLQPYPAFSSVHRLDTVWLQPVQEHNLDDDKQEDLEAPFSEEEDEPHPYRSPNYPPLWINRSRDVVLSGGQVMPRLTPQSDNERSALSLKLEAYYGSPPKEFSEIKGEEKAFSVTFSMENAGPKLKQHQSDAVDNCVHIKIDSTKMAQIDIENATTHHTLLTKLKNYLRQLDGTDDYRVTAFFRSRTLKSASQKRMRIKVLKNMLMNGLPANFDTITPTRQAHYPIINRNITQFQKALNENDNVLFGAPREPVALNYTKQAMSFVSCGQYQPLPPQGQELMEDINRLVKTNMRI